MKEEDENALLDDIDELAKKRNFSLAPAQFKLTLESLRKGYV